MPKYMAIYKQKGEGCDYTIGCGTRAEEFDAVDLTAAIVHARSAAFSDDGMDHDECEIDSIHVVAMDNVVTVDCDQARSDRDDLANASAAGARFFAERAEYERLRKKFE